MLILKICLEEQLLINYSIEKAFDIAKNLIYDGYQRALPSMVIKCLDKKAIDTSSLTETEIKFTNQWLAEKLHKQIIK